MKPGQSTFEERLARIHEGETQSAPEVTARGTRLIQTAPKKSRFHYDMLAAGGLAGGVAGTLFAMNIGWLFLLTLDSITIYGLVLADFKLGAYMAACALAPLAFLWTLIFSASRPRAFQFAAAYNVGVLGANYTDLRFWIETVIIPAFWQFMDNYTTASEYMAG